MVKFSSTVIICFVLIVACDIFKSRPSEESLISFYLETLKKVGSSVNPPVEFHREGNKIRFGEWTIEITSIDFEDAVQSKFRAAEKFPWAGRLNVKWFQNGKEIPMAGSLSSMELPYYLTLGGFSEKFIALYSKEYAKWMKPGDALR